MFKFFKNKNNSSKIQKNDQLLLKATSLLIHAAKIDENYTNKEKSIIKETISNLDDNNSNINKLMILAENKEKDANEILNFTKAIKRADVSFKIKIFQTLWKIIYSNKEADMYESNLMSRLSGLLYIDNKLAAKIKERARIESSK